MGLILLSPTLNSLSLFFPSHPLFEVPAYQHVSVGRLKVLCLMPRLSGVIPNQVHRCKATCHLSSLSPKGPPNSHKQTVSAQSLMVLKGTPSKEESVLVWFCSMRTKSKHCWGGVTIRTTSWFFVVNEVFLLSIFCFLHFNPNFASIFIRFCHYLTGFSKGGGLRLDSHKHLWCSVWPL